MRLSPTTTTLVACVLGVASPALAQRAPTLADLDTRLAAVEARLTELTPASPDALWKTPAEAFDELLRAVQAGVATTS